MAEHLPTSQRWHIKSADHATNVISPLFLHVRLIDIILQFKNPSHCHRCFVFGGRTTVGYSDSLSGARLKNWDDVSCGSPFVSTLLPDLTTIWLPRPSGNAVLVFYWTSLCDFNNQLLKCVWSIFSTVYAFSHSGHSWLKCVSQMQLDFFWRSRRCFKEAFWMDEHLPDCVVLLMWALGACQHNP